MHVVHVIARLNDGGPVRVLAALLPELHRLGIRSTVIAGDCSPDEPDRTAWLQAHGVVVERLPGLGRSVRLGDDWHAFTALRERLRTLAPDVVHTHTAKAGFLGRVACRLGRIPCLHTYHGHVLDGYFSHPVTVALAHLERAVASNHHHHGLTPTQVLDLSRCFRIGRPHTWHVLPVPVPAVRPQPYVAWSTALRRRTPVVGFLGRLVPVKDIDLFLDTLVVLSHHRPVQGLICGDGPLREHAEFRAAQLELRVHFTGFIPAGEALAQMDALLITSRNEGQPLVAIEAASAGVPVVAPAVGGLADLIHWRGVAGAERTAEALAAAVDRLIADPDHRQAQITAGRRLAARLTPGALAPQYAALYRSLTVLMLCLWSVLLSGVELAPQFTQAVTGDLLTWELRDPQPAWISTDTERTPQLAITGPDGKTTVRSAFAVEQGLWVRHVVRQAGLHRWRLRDAEGKDLARGSLDAVAGNAPPGPVRVSSRNHRLLSFADGTPFLPIGPNIAWVDGDPVAGFTRTFATLAGVGGNHARVWQCTWSLGLEGEQPGAFRLDRAAQMDGVLAAARAAGIRLTVVLDNHTDVLGGQPFPYGNGIEERQNAFFAVPPTPAWRQRLRYCLARWGADDTIVAWELMNEVDLALPVRARAIAWITAAARELARADRDHRLHTVSWFGDDWPAAVDTTDIDLVQLHGYVLEFVAGENEALKQASRDGVGMFLPHAAIANTGHRPWMLGEVGYQGTVAENPGNDLDPEGFLLRQQLWAGFLLGGCGGGMTWWWDSYLDAHNLWPVYRPFATITKRLDLRDPDLVPIAPNPTGQLRLLGWASPRQALLWPQLREDTWHRALVARRPRPAATIDLPVRLSGFLPSRHYQVTPFDPNNGTAAHGQVMTADAEGKLAFVLPAGTLDVIWHLALTPE